MAKDKNNPVEKNPERVTPELETDQFSPEEQEDIVRFVKQDLQTDTQTMQEWVNQRVKDIQMYEGDRPSKIESLSKEAWMSDRNLGLCAANCDSYQATLLSTCYNIDTIHFQATEENDVDHKEQLDKFEMQQIMQREGAMLEDEIMMRRQQMQQQMQQVHQQQHQNQRPYHQVQKRR